MSNGRNNIGYGLTHAEIEHFLARGFVVIKDAVKKNIREEWFRHGLQRLSRVKRVPDNGIIELTHTRSEFLHDIAPRAWKAVTQLLGGEDRVAVPQVHDDFNFNTQSVPETEWLPPERHSSGWHIDGDFFKRYLDSPEQGLLCLILWSGVSSREGGTFLACDSIGKVAKLLLANSSQGLDPRPFTLLYKECSDFVEITGDAGDVVLCHPFMIHAPSPRTNDNVRLLTNPPVSLLEPMQFNRADARDFSPVELAILRGLGVERLEFSKEKKREQFDPWRQSRAINEAVS
ncbi:MAG TPA: hypothetical protein VG962_04650 [Steroidobacteraceae bacterium]|nr:hypothetical protein [Steroidobacteraceae bacterium]